MDYFNHYSKRYSTISGQENDVYRRETVPLSLSLSLSLSLTLSHPLSEKSLFKQHGWRELESNKGNVFSKWTHAEQFQWPTLPGNMNHSFSSSSCREAFIGSIKRQSLSQRTVIRFLTRSFKVRRWGGWVSNRSSNCFHVTSQTLCFWNFRKLFWRITYCCSINDRSLRTLRQRWISLKQVGQRNKRDEAKLFSSNFSHFSENEV